MKTRISKFNRNKRIKNNKERKKLKVQEHKAYIKSVVEKNLNSWRPNWKNPDDYPDELTNMRVWAWEFLRRNHDYQRSFFYGAQKVKALAVDDSDIIEGMEVEDWDDSFKESLYEKTLFHYSLAKINYVEKESLILFRMLPPWVDNAGIKTNNHSKDTSENLEDIIFSEAEVARFILNIEDFEECKNDYGTIAMKFNVFLPIDAQLEKARKKIEEARKKLEGSHDKNIYGKSQRTRTNQLKDYLRLLDAQFSGATIVEMASEIQKKAKGTNKQDHKNSVESKLKTAINMMKINYKYLPFRQL
jgi:hypothetical protein